MIYDIIMIVAGLVFVVVLYVLFQKRKPAKSVNRNEESSDLSQDKVLNKSGSDVEKNDVAIEESRNVDDDESDAVGEEDNLLELNRERPDTGGLVYILVAEDNISNYKLVEVMLRNIAVTENAVNGKVAVEMAKTKDYDMIFMDVKMPIMGGLDATREIRTFDTKIPIIAVTANVLDFDKNMALACGCNEFVPKPIIRARLCEVVETYKRK